MASYPINARGLVPWPINTSTAGLVTVANPDPIVPIYVQSATSAGVPFDQVKVHPSTQMQIHFPAGGTVGAAAAQNISNITVT